MEMVAKKSPRDITFVFVLFVCVLFILAILPIAGNGQVSCDRLYLITSSTANPPGSQLTATRRFGYVNCKGEVIAKPEYDEGEEFTDGVGVLRRGEDSYLVYSTGRIRKLCGLQVRDVFSNGLAVVRKKNTHFIIDRDGNLKSRVIRKVPGGKQIDYDDVNGFTNGLAPALTDDGFGFIDTSGKLVIEPKFQYTNGFYDGMAVVTIAEKSALINTRGEYVIPPIEDTNIGILDASDGLAQVYKTLPDEEHLIRFFDKDGTLVLSVTRFNYVGRFAEGLAKVNIQDKWGFINRKGKLVIEPRFDDVEEFSEGLAAVRVDNKWGFIDREGKFTIAPRFLEVRTFSFDMTGFKGGAVLVEEKNRIGYINRKGEWIWSRFQ